MSRHLLAPLLHQRHIFQGTFEKYSLKSGWQGHMKKTMLLLHITWQGKEVTDHVWLTVGKRLGAFEFKQGDIIQFKATVLEYEKGYRGHRYDDEYYFDAPSIDYKLAYPDDIKKSGVDPSGPTLDDAVA